MQFKSYHTDLHDEILKRALSKPIYQKLVVKWPGVKKVNGHVTELNVWGKYGKPLLDSAERISITFDIQVLHILQNLAQFDLGGTGVKGDIQVLQGFQHLTKFDLQCTNVFGDIRVLQELQHLTQFRLCDTVVKGDIQVLQELQNLTEFQLMITGVTGDEEAFHEYRKSHGLKVCRVTL